MCKNVVRTFAHDVWQVQYYRQNTMMEEDELGRCPERWEEHTKATALTFFQKKSTVRVT